MTKNLKFLPLLLVALSGCRSESAPETVNPPVAPTAPARVETALDRYIARPESAYKWAGAPELVQSANETDLTLTSQVWQGNKWTHRLQIFVPQKMLHADACLINVSFGSGSFAETFAGQALADATGNTVVNLFNVPNQPLYDRTEDDLIAYTFAKYLETGDETWPLLLPMTKSVTQAMNALQQWSAKDGHTKLTRFIISGASKRGWTTDLVAAVDPRVVGIVPIVYDNLNIPAQIQHQIQNWGKTSDLTSAYNDIGLFQQMQTEAGKKLLGIVDPYSYKNRLTMPKLLVHATNDGYWSLDSQRFYWSEIPGENRLFEVPNVPHTLGNSFAAVAGSAAAWGKLVLSGKPVPNVKLEVQEKNGARQFTATTDGAPTVVRLWLANSASQDFRAAQWRSVEPLPRDGAYRATLTGDQLFGKGQRAAAFAEIEIEAKPLPLKLSSLLWQGEK